MPGSRGRSGPKLPRPLHQLGVDRGVAWTGSWPRPHVPRTRSTRLCLAARARCLPKLCTGDNDSRTRRLRSGRRDRGQGQNANRLGAEHGLSPLGSASPRSRSPGAAGPGRSAGAYRRAPAVPDLGSDRTGMNGTGPRGSRGPVLIRAEACYLSQLLIVSLPGPPLQLSLPAPPNRWSLPAPPRRVSLPAPPRRVSLPAPPRRVSLPAPHLVVSLPAPPRMVSLSPPPMRVSSPPAPPRLLGPVFPVSVSANADPAASSTSVIVSLPAPPVAWAVVSDRFTVTPAVAVE